MPPINDTRLSWLPINDFTPGIRTKLNFPTTGSVAAPAKIGEAQATNTFRCIALPTGGLTAMPRAVATPAAPTIGVTPAGSGDGFYHIVGFHAFGPIGPDAVPTGFIDDLFIGIEFLTATPNRRFRWYRMALHTTGTPNNLLRDITSAVAVTSDVYNGITQGTTRIHPTTDTIPGNPTVAMSWSPPSFAADREVTVFPDPDTPGTTSIETLAGRSGDLVFHQGRIVLLEYNTYPFGGGGGDATPTNENISFTSANLRLSTMTAATAAQVFVPEFPHGTGTDGSISAGELFLVKNRGGGVRVSGDIANPIVTRLPGVVSTGNFGGHAASLPSGLFYVSPLGSYLWRGADTATKISEQLDDMFWNHPDSAKVLNKQWQATEWGDWVVLSNNWVWDTNTGTWWRLEDTSVYNLIWSSRGALSHILFTSTAKYTDATVATVIRQYDRNFRHRSYSWQSHPIPVSNNRLVDVREVVVRAQGPGTVTITLTGVDGDTPSQPGVFTITETNAPQMIRQPLYCKGENITVRIEANSGSDSLPAPIVYEVRLGFVDQQMGSAT